MYISNFAGPNNNFINFLTLDFLRLDGIVTIYALFYICLEIYFEKNSINTAISFILE